MADQIKSWSYSRLTTFEQCKFRAKLAFLDKIPEPDRPLPPGKSEHASDRGTRIHESAEKFIQGGVKLIHELKTFEPEFLKLRELYAEGKVSLEGEWAINNEWEPVPYYDRDTWARIKLDVFVRLDERHAVVIDYKTGKRYGNEIKHGEQTQLYQLAAFLRYPELEFIDVELWYTDIDEIHHMRFTKAQGLKFFQNFDRRGKAITSETKFPPNPNIFSCKWCPYGPKGTGHCTRGV